MHLTPKEHPSEDTLENYLLRPQEGQKEAAEIEKHLVVCPACRRKADALQDYIKAMQNALSTQKAGD